jgi:Na+/phosphate symporter
MNLEEFESQYRAAIDETLNQLQTATLLLAQAQAKVLEIGSYVQNLSQTVEEFIAEQKSE